MEQLFIYNTLARAKQPFKPIHEGRVGMYVCGPTVYGDAHLGHARPAITFDILYRYLLHLGYKVRYVRNITDVGHLEHDADEGEDKIAKKARLEQLEPMEVAQYYTLRYHEAMNKLNVLPPTIEPRASGHIIEQIEFVKKILENGFAYESNGSIYFDIEAYSKKFKYGKLSGRNVEEISRPPAPLTVRMRSAARAILPFGNALNLNTLCAGLRLGATVSLAGISSARQWAASIWAKNLIFTVAVWT